MDDIEWGPWIEHDGARPEPWLPSAQWLFCCTMVDNLDPALISESTDGRIGPSDPRFYWRWRRVNTGWFTSERRRVCDDPAYAPIVRYRFGRPRQRSAAITRLDEIVANPFAPVTGPEGPRRPAPQPPVPAEGMEGMRPPAEGMTPKPGSGGSQAGSSTCLPFGGDGEDGEDKCNPLARVRASRGQGE